MHTSFVGGAITTVKAIGIGVGVSRIAAHVATCCARRGRAGVQVRVWRGECVVVTPNRVQDRRVCIFKMATKLESELLACREESGKCELTHSLYRQESGRCVGGVPHDGDAMKWVRYAGSRGY